MACDVSPVAMFFFDVLILIIVIVFVCLFVLRQLQQQHLTLIASGQCSLVCTGGSASLLVTVDKKYEMPSTALVILSTSPQPDCECKHVWDSGGVASKVERGGAVISREAAEAGHNAGWSCCSPAFPENPCSWSA